MNKLTTLVLTLLLCFSCSKNEDVDTIDIPVTTTPRPIAQLLPNLSQLNLFEGPLKDLTPSPYSFTYTLNTPLFTDYAHKARFIVLPEGETLTAVGNGMPEFPDNSIIVKSFYYNFDENDLCQGKKIIETRLLIKQYGTWIAGDYHWNEAQTEAVLENNAATVPVSFIDKNGTTVAVNYQIPSNLDCITCHSNNNQVKPLGPKLRSINYNNQLQTLINNNQITGISDISTITTLPNWEDDTSYSLQDRARAYLDVNCASCHQPGGYCDVQTTLDFS